MAPPSPNPGDSGSLSSMGSVQGRRWQKTSFLRSALGQSVVASGGGPGDAGSLPDHAGQGGGRQKIVDPETDAHFEGLLSSETSMVVLDALETIVQVRKRTPAGADSIAVFESMYYELAIIISNCSASTSTRRPTSK